MQVDKYLLQAINRMFDAKQLSALTKLKKEDPTQTKYILDCLKTCEEKVFFLTYILDNRCRCYVENIPINYQLSKICRICVKTTPGTLACALQTYRLAGIDISIECKKIIKN